MFASSCCWLPIWLVAFFVSFSSAQIAAKQQETLTNAQRLKLGLSPAIPFNLPKQRGRQNSDNPTRVRRAPQAGPSVPAGGGINLCFNGYITAEYIIPNPFTIGIVGIPLSGTVGIQIPTPLHASISFCTGFGFGFFGITGQPLPANYKIPANTPITPATNIVAKRFNGANVYKSPYFIGAANQKSITLKQNLATYAVLDAVPRTDINKMWRYMEDTHYLIPHYMNPNGIRSLAHIVYLKKENVFIFTGDYKAWQKANPSVDGRQVHFKFHSYDESN